MSCCHLACKNGHVTFGIHAIGRCGGWYWFLPSGLFLVTLLSTWQKARALCARNALWGTVEIAEKKTRLLGQLRDVWRYEMKAFRSR